MGGVSQKLLVCGRDLNSLSIDNRINLPIELPKGLYLGCVAFV